MLDSMRDDAGKLPAYAWPGGYPLLYVLDDGESLCSDCVNDPSNPIHEGGEPDGWRLEGCEIHWEGSPATCAHCGRETPSAYGE